MGGRRGALSRPAGTAVPQPATVFSRVWCRGLRGGWGLGWVVAVRMAVLSVLVALATGAGAQLCSCASAEMHRARGGAGSAG